MILKFIASKIRVLQAFADALVVVVAWTASYWIRFDLIGSAQTGLEQTFAFWVLPLVGITLYFLLKNEHYDRSNLGSVTNDVMRLFRANALSVVTFIIVLYFSSDARISRLTIVVYAICSTFTLILARILIRSLIRKIRRRGYLLQKVFVVGDGPQLRRYLESTDYAPGTGIRIAAVFGGVSQSAGQARNFELGDLERAIAEQHPDRVVFGFADENSSFVSSFIRKHYDDLFSIQVLVAENQALLGLNSEVVDGIHIMTLNEPKFSPLELVMKRAFDSASSFLGLVILSPLLLVLAVLVRISSPGPIFFGQERVGIGGRTFRMWKFRTMKAGSLEESKGWTVENDPRRTRIGTLMRKTSLDELPQLWNVLVGDMSLVGPRPEQTHFVDKFRREIPAYMLRHKMKAGITGWAQVSGWRGDTSLHKRIEYDLFYIRNWSFWFDLKILALTVVRGLINKNAY